MHQTKTLFFLFIFSLAINPFFLSGTSHAVEFEIDEIITAIKNEIQTANNPELGTPSFIIENVHVALSVASKETEKGAMALKIIGSKNEIDNDVLSSKSFHKLNYTFKPAEMSGFSPEISLGLVEPIMRAKASFRKACNTPPSLQIDEFTFKIEFAIVQSLDEKIRFKILGLEALKAQKVTTHHLTLKIKVLN